MTSSNDAQRLRLLLPKPVLPSSALRAMVTQKLVGSVVNEPPLRQKLRDFSTVFNTSPQQPPNARVIAVQGISDKETRFVAQFLTHYIQKELGAPVRIFGDLEFPTAADTDYEQHSHHVQNWFAISDFIAMAAPPSIEQAQDQPLILPTTPLPSIDVHKATTLYVNIVPISPLMVTTRAAIEGPSEAAVWSERKWRSLLSHWRGAKKPNIIINVQAYQSGVENGEVLRIIEGDFKGLIVVTAKKREVDITAKQLRRIAFEVIEWLRDE
ncbi:MAG: hypothetical protein Q9178_006478 [Gyalolechia marmorata]